jgi:DNA-binding MarR family transcriptional regulator
MEIADRMIEPACGITRLIGALEEKDLIRREQWPGDRRQVLCQITPAGIRLLDRLQQPMDELDELTARSLTAEQIDTFIEILSRIRENTEMPQ